MKLNRAYARGGSLSRHDLGDFRHVVTLGIVLFFDKYLDKEDADARRYNLDRF